MRQTAETTGIIAARQTDRGPDRCRECGATCGAELEISSQLSCTTCQQRILAEFGGGSIRLHAFERVLARAIN